MGNRRFKLSDMMPNAWFYKLRDMSKVRSQSNKNNMQSSTQNPRRSFYYTSDSKLCLSPPTTKKRARRKTVYMPSPRKEPPTSSDRISLSGFDQSYLSSSASDIIIDVDDTSIHIDTLTEFHLPPIHTKPRKDSSLFHDTSIQFPPEKPRRSRRSPGSRKSFSGGVKIRGTARTLTRKNPEGRRRKNAAGERKKGMFYSESFAIVKASFDPEKDFKESMMEMIVENNIRASKDLEELLACYLSLNSNQYHDMIIKAFEQIWFSMAQHHF